MSEMSELLAEVRAVGAQLDRVEVALNEHRDTTAENTAALGRRTMRQRVALIGLAIVFLLFALNYRAGRQGDCSRSNDFRLQIRLQIVTVIRLLDPAQPSTVAGQVDEQLRRDFPARDCGGLLP